MAELDYSAAVSAARDYYNSDDADNFYFHVWGGEDIHIGLYASDDEPIAAASHRTVEHLAGRLDGLRAGARVLDLGAGYGGAARHLAKTHGVHVTALNLSEVENQRNRAMSAEQGLAEQVDVLDGSFEQVPRPDASFDVVWSQDAILHSGDREQVLREVVRVLKPGGQFVFTDPMRSDDCPPGVLQPILDRIHLEDLGCPGFYARTAADVGLEDQGFEDMTPMLVRHYTRVLHETQRREGDLDGKVSADYLTRMKAGLQHWIDGGTKGYLAWGVFLFRKPA